MRAILTTLFCAVLLVACTGTPSDGTTDTPAATGDERPAAVGTAPGTDDAKSVFGSMFGASVEYMVAYDVTSTVEGKSMTTQMTQYNKIKGTDYKMRMDSSYAGVEMRTIIADDSYVSCTKQDGEWTCFAPPKGEEDDTFDNPQEDAQEYAEDDTSTVVRDGTMQVAGVTAECFLVTMPAADDYDGSSTRYCLKDNVPLYVKSSDGKGTVISEMKATAYKKSVSDSDFTPPAEPTAMPSYGGAAGGTFPEGYELPEDFDPSDYAAR